MPLYDVDLKPCPFCGTDDKVQLIMVQEGGTRGYCRHCGSSGPSSTEKEAEGRVLDAIAKWNNRPYQIQIQRQKGLEHGNNE